MLAQAEAQLEMARKGITEVDRDHNPALWDRLHRTREACEELVVAKLTNGTGVECSQRRGVRPTGRASDQGQGTVRQACGEGGVPEAGRRGPR